MKWFLHVMVIILLLVFINVSSAVIIWVNPDNKGTENGSEKSTGYKTLWKAMSIMHQGDTVIIANGNWLGYPGMVIDTTHYPNPPNGTSEAYSRIHAETDWEVTLNQVYLVSKSYIEIRGIVFDARVNIAPLRSVTGKYNKFIRCGFLQGKTPGNSNCFSLWGGGVRRTDSQYNLMEECIFWGGGRYMAMDYHGQYNVFRRCVVRHDNQEPGTPDDDGQIGNFRAYTCDYDIYQNCISIDSDRAQYYNNGNLQGQALGFYVGDSTGADGHEIQGCISIKDLNAGYYLGNTTDNIGNTVIKNSITLSLLHYNNSPTLNGFIVANYGNLFAENITGINATTDSTSCGYNSSMRWSPFNIKNSIALNVTGAGELGTTNTYMNHYNVGAGTWGTGSTSYDPRQNGLLYLVRIEEGSALATAGKGGTVCGATILKKIGVSGTLYGELGWDEVTNEDLWPFPNENKIKELMSETVEGVSGIYGFTAYISPFGSPNTLTSYIWEYLGNQIPSEIYGENPPPPLGQPGKPEHIDR